MAFTSTLDAQIQLVNAIIARKALETQLSTYNDANDPTKSSRLATKTGIKNQQVIIDSANKYLMSAGIDALRYLPNIVNEDNLVTTTWSNEDQVPNTLKNSLLNIPETTFAEIKQTQAVINEGLKEANKLLDKAKEKLESVKSDPNKTVLLSEAQYEFDINNENVQRFIKSKVALEESLKHLAQTPEIETVRDLFSDKIRKQVRDSILRNPGLSASEVEPAIIMRKKALDALYTAKTDDEKRIALERLHHSAQVDQEVIRTTVSFNPNQYQDLITAIDQATQSLISASDAYADAQNDLATAMESGDLTAISNAQVQLSMASSDLEDKKHDKRILEDQLLGFRDSPLKVSMYPGSTTVANELPRQKTTELDDLNTNSETKEFKAQQQQNKNRNLANNDYLYDTKTARYVKRENADFSQSGRYVEARRVTTKEHENNRLELNRQYIERNYEAEVNHINDDIADEEEYFAAITETRKNDIAKLEKKISAEQDSAKKAELERQKAEITTELSSATIEHQSKISSLTLQKEKAENTKIRSIGAAEESYESALKRSSVEASEGEARAVLNRFDSSVVASDNAEINFNKTRQLAIDRARQNNPDADPFDPANWAEEDRDQVNARLETLNEARSSELEAAIEFDQYANTVPGGRESLNQIGLNENDIDRRLAGGDDSVENIRARNTLSLTDVGTAANSIESSNIRSMNGFESVNNGAPFYIQMPTMKALTDFHISNGINPYGKSRDEIARDAIHFNIFEVAPPAPRARLVEGTSGIIRNEVEAALSNTVGSFTIYPHKHEYLQMNHTHHYSNESGVADFVNGLLGVVDGLDVGLSLFNAATTSALQGREEGIPQKVSRHVDKIGTYTGSEKLSLNIEFKLFTKRDFLRDIFRPLMFLTALSYPKRSLSGGLEREIVKAAQNINTLKNSTNVPSAIRNIAQLLDANGVDASQIAKIAGNIESKIAATGGLGPYRYFVTKRPEYLSIRHASGLFYFPLAAITQVSYSFEGPWYNTNGEQIPGNGKIDEAIRLSLSDASRAGSGGSFSDVFNNLRNVFRAPTSAGGPRKLGGVDSAFDIRVLRGTLDQAFPSIATVSVNVANLVPTFRDDYLDLFYAAGQNANSVVSVTEQQTGTIPENRIDRTSGDFRRIE